jgi:hypothetical protein
VHDAGRPVIRPGCAHCGKIRTDLRQLRPEGRICGTCDARSRKGTCGRCGVAETKIIARRPEGGICNRSASIPRLSRGARSAPSSATQQYAYPTADHSAGRAANAPCTRAMLRKDGRRRSPRRRRGLLPPVLHPGTETPPTLRKMRQAREDRPQRSRRPARPLRQLLPGPGDHLFTLRTDKALPTDQLR